MTAQKIKVKDAIRTTTMFLNDASIEQRYERIISSQIEAYKQMADISTREELEQFIRSNSDSVKMLITLLGISTEKFKRVVTMLRVEKGYTFDSEWDEARVRRELCEKNDLMEEFCELFINGYNIERYKEKIPHFVLQDFRIDKDIIDRLCNEDMLRKLTKSSVTSKYNKDYSNYYADKIQEYLRTISAKYGLRYEYGIIEGFSGDHLHSITNTEKRIIVNYQFNLTTSKGQTDYASKTIYPIWHKSRERGDFIVVNMLDGAGWVARSADYKKVHMYCDYFLNLNTLNQIEDIIKQTFKID